MSKFKVGDDHTPVFGDVRHKYQDKEMWAPAPGHEGYFISNYGRLKSEDRYIKTKTGKRFIKGKEHKPVNDKGYAKFYMNGKANSAHRLVALAFIPNPEGKLTVNHIDSDRGNPHHSRFEWATYQEQADHAWAVGGSKGKLTNLDIYMIQSLYKNGFSSHDIAKKFGVVPSHVRLIANNKSCKRIEPNKYNSVNKGELVYAVCDEKGKNPSKVFMFKENALNYGRLNLTNYTIRPYALTPINE